MSLKIVAFLIFLSQILKSQKHVINYIQYRIIIQFLESIFSKSYQMISKLQCKTRTLTLLQRTAIHIPSQSRNIHGNARQIFQICNITQKFERTSLLDRQFVTRGNSDLKPSFYCEIAKYPILSILVFLKIIMRYRCSQEGSSQLQNNKSSNVYVKYVLTADVKTR